MKHSIPIAAIVFFLSLQSQAQQEAGPWERYNFLMGDWVGEGEGTPGEGSGYFSFTMKLDNTILLRNNHSEYPAAQGRPAAIHDDLLILYRETPDPTEKAIYFDNEGHVIRYSVAQSTAGVLEFVSEPREGMPFFRFTYSKIEDGYVKILFEISQDGSNYRRYLEGKARRKK